MSAPWNPFDWLSARWPELLGLGSLFVFLKRGYSALRKLEGYGQRLDDLEIIKTNHLPHIQQTLDSVNDNVTGLREDVKDGLSRLTDSINVVLQRMP